MGNESMIAACPKCRARYRIDAARLGPQGMRLRCSKCEAVFRVAPPAAQAPVAEGSAPAAMPEVSAQALADAPQATVSPSRLDASEPRSEADRLNLVLLADPDVQAGKAIANTLVDWGLEPVLVHDGVEAIMTIQRILPRGVILDAGLPKMFGFQVCEIVKRNESLRHVKVVLVGAIHHQDRYRRDPSELYGADLYIESPDLPDGLLPLLREAGLSVEEDDTTHSASTSASPTPTAEPGVQSGPIPEPSVDPSVAAASLELTSPVVSPSAVATAEAEDPERTAERERAQRLARIAVSEMVLYQPEKFDQATRDGTLEQTLDLEIQEARALLRQRIGEEIRAEKDFIIEELNRVAQERGGQG